jgi:hypothetical protein
MPPEIPISVSVTIVKYIAIAICQKISIILKVDHAEVEFSFLSMCDITTKDVIFDADGHLWFGQANQQGSQYSV